MKNSYYRHLLHELTLLPPDEQPSSKVQTAVQHMSQIMYDAEHEGFASHYAVDYLITGLNHAMAGRSSDEIGNFFYAMFYAGNKVALDSVTDDVTSHDHGMLTHMAHLFKALDTEGLTIAEVREFIPLFKAAINFEVLSALTDNPNEWVGDMNGIATNKRCQHVRLENGEVIDNNAVIVSEDGGVTWSTGTWGGVCRSNQVVELPYLPQSIYAYVNQVTHLSFVPPNTRPWIGAMVRHANGQMWRCANIVTDPETNGTSYTLTNVQTLENIIIGDTELEVVLERYGIEYPQWHVRSFFSMYLPENAAS